MKGLWRKTEFGKDGWKRTGKGQDEAGKKNLRKDGRMKGKQVIGTFFQFKKNPVKT